MRPITPGAALLEPYPHGDKSRESGTLRHQLRPGRLDEGVDRVLVGPDAQHRRHDELTRPTFRHRHEPRTHQHRAGAFLHDPHT